MSYNNIGSLYRKEQAMVDWVMLTGFGSIRDEVYGKFNDACTFIGCPSETGEGTFRTVDDGFAILTNSDHIDGAWEFIKFYLQTDVNGDDQITSFTRFYGLEEKYQKTLEENTHPTVWTFNEEVGKEVSHPYFRGDEGTYDCPPFTEEEAKKYDAFVRESLRHVRRSDVNINSILDDELAAFFAGDKTAEDAAKMIQSRVSLYMGERYS